MKKYKKLLCIFLAVAILLVIQISVVSAADWDDFKTYDRENREYTIRNLFGLGKEIAKLQLKTPDIYSVARGYQRVAEVEIKNGAYDYENIIKGIELYNLKDGDKEIIRGIDYKYKDFINDVPIYEEVCDDKKLNENGTATCSWNISGYKSRVVWKDWDETLLKRENITLGLYTTVKKGDTVEWILSVYGRERLTKWAIFNETIDVSLVASYPHNESTGTNLADYIGFNDNGTTYRMENGDWTGLALDYDGVNENVNMSNLENTLNGAESFSIAFNVVFDNVTLNQNIMDDLWDGTRSNYNIGISAPTKLYWHAEATGGNGAPCQVGGLADIDGGETFSTGTNYTIILAVNNTGIWTWINGIGKGRVQTCIANGTYETGGLEPQFAAPTVAEGGGYFNGRLGQVSFWKDRSLVDSEAIEVTRRINGTVISVLYPTVTLNTPVNAFNTTSPTVDFNCSVSDDNGITNVSLVINGTIEQTNSTGTNDIFYLFTETLTTGTGLYNWSCLVFDDVNQVAIAVARNFTYSNALAVSLNSPVNAYNSTTSNITFNGTASDDTAVINVSLYIDGILNETNSSGLNNTFYLFTKNVSDGDHNWTYEACDIFDCLSATARTFTVDATLPTINITYPTEEVDYHIINTNLSLNWTAIDSNLDACWYDYNGTNVTVTCLDNTTSINITDYLNRNVTFFINDTFGNLNGSFREWIYKVFENKQTFSPTTIIGATETYVNNIFLGSGETIIEINLNYNGTDRSATYLNLGGDEYNLSSTFIVPSVALETNISFFWKINLASGQINTISKNQTVQNITMDDCSVFNTLIFNYTIINEESQLTLTNETLLELDIEIFDSSKTVSILNFSRKYDDVNPALVCLSINLTNETIYSLDSTVKYEASDYTANQSINYSIEYYNIQNFSLQNSSIPQTINLFDLDSSDAIEFQITFKDSNFVTIEDALIQINRQYISEGLFKTVEIPKTDSNGQTVAHLVEKDVVYNMIVLKEGEILGTFNNIIAFCEDILIGSCFISLNALEGGEVSFEYNDEIGLLFNFDYNETSRGLQFDFSTTDGSVKNVSLSSIKIDQLGNTSVCDGFLVSASGSILCSVPASIGNETIIVSIFVDGDLKITNYIQAGREFDIGDAGYFLMFFLVLSLALMMTSTKTGVIVGVVLGFISGTLLSFIQGGIVGIGSSVIWLIIMGIVLIYKLNSQGQT